MPRSDRTPAIVHKFVADRRPRLVNVSSKSEAACYYTFDCLLKRLAYSTSAKCLAEMGLLSPDDPSPNLLPRVTDGSHATQPTSSPPFHHARFKLHPSVASCLRHAWPGEGSYFRLRDLRAIEGVLGDKCTRVPLDGSILLM